MSTKPENKRKLMIAVGAIVVAVGVTVGTTIWSAARTAASDRANLLAQRRASGVGDPADRQRQRLNQMAGELGLTEAQKVSVAKLNAEMWGDGAGGRPPENESREKRRERREKQRREQDTRMARILTDEQFAKYKTLQQQRGPGMGRQGRGGPGGRMPPGGPPPGSQTNG